MLTKQQSNLTQKENVILRSSKNNQLVPVKLMTAIWRVIVNCNIVKAWSKSESKPLSQQTPKLNKSPPKKWKKKDLDQRLKLKSHGPPTPPHSRLLTHHIANCSFSTNKFLSLTSDPLDPTQKKIDQMDSKIKDLGKSYMFEKYINWSTLTLKWRVVKYYKMSTNCL